jgi:hypothetical protein
MLGAGIAFLTIGMLLVAFAVAFFYRTLRCGSQRVCPGGNDYVADWMSLCREWNIPGGDGSAKGIPA